MAYVDFAYYSDAVNGFGGTAILSTNFNKYERQARVFLDNITFNRLQADATLITAIVKDCLCTIMEENLKLDQEEAETGGKLISSETVGNTSTTYAVSDLEKNTVDKNQIVKLKMYNIAKEYLINSGLMYRGG